MTGKTMLLMGLILDLLIVRGKREKEAEIGNETAEQYGEVI